MDVLRSLDDLMSVKAAAARLNLTQRGVRKLIESGVLPARKLGPNWFIHPGDLERDEVKNRRGRGRPPKSKPSV
jgi:excisionase family DNA binding protein